ncbi:PTS sugar transporter subunit IIA [Microbacterium oleivorans]|uniref:PTS glucose transporter subunit IIA n=1 Tax=Microbacterium oleivorans TaxID=273677 RepID=A0A7D5IRG2_9MICO|nr:PTS glucose transporter subunit IIA [Microbacterium oleivorans]QLD12799.1 PTS glucose transporter subunit IIA [Microbacterium oleivorans]
MKLFGFSRRAGDSRDDHAPRGEALRSPATGELIALESVPDEMFAQRMLGDGFAVDPASGVFRAPIAGELVVLASTLHAFAIRAESGLEVLVHIGIDTVDLGGVGFASSRAVGEHVEAGDEIIRCDLALVRDAVPSMVTPVIVTNSEAFAVRDLRLDAADGDVVARADRRP